MILYVCSLRNLFWIYQREHVKQSKQTKKTPQQIQVDKQKGHPRLNNQLIQQD